MTDALPARVAESEAQALADVIHEALTWRRNRQAAHAAADGLLSVVATLQQERDEAVTEEAFRRRERDTALDALVAVRERETRLRETLEPTLETRDYLTRTIATIRNHRDADNCWPQWANLLADEIERMWAALVVSSPPPGAPEEAQSADADVRADAKEEA
jgi:hypothetical protein